MNYKSPFITRSRYRDDWNLMPRYSKRIHKDLQSEVFDEVPMREGIGKHLNDYAYCTRALDRWFRSHLNEPWSQVQQKLKERLPRDYNIAAREVQSLYKDADGVLLLNASKWWGTRMMPLSEGAQYSPFFYVDLNGFLREQSKIKYTPRAAKIQIIDNGEHYWFKRKGITYKALMTCALIECAHKGWNRFMRTSYDSYGDIIFYVVAKNTWMRIHASNIRQASKKDIDRHCDVIKLITDDLTIGTPELTR